jgi:hypothetical protein
MRGNGDRAATLYKLMPVLYQELRRLARRKMLGQSPGHSLQTTDLIHQAYMKLVNVEDAVWKDSIHFWWVNRERCAPGGALPGRRGIRLSEHTPG